MLVENIIEDMISLSVKNRLEYPGPSTLLHPVQYAYEFKTITAGLPRRCGKSTFVKEFVKSTSDKILIVTHNEYAKREFRDISANVDVISQHENLLGFFFNRMTIRGGYQYIIFDEYSMIKKEAIESVYYHTANQGNTLQTYIQIGTPL